MKDILNSGKNFFNQDDFKDISLMREYPSNIEAEKSVLGAFLLDNSLFENHFNEIVVSDFFSQKNKIIFEMMVKLYEKNAKIDVILLQEELVKNGLIDEVGGVSYIFSLQENLFSLGLVEKYILILKEKRILRGIIESSTSLISQCYSQNDFEIETIIDKAEKMFFEIAKEKTKKDYIQLDLCLKKTFEDLVAIKSDSNGVTGVSSGYFSLDKMTGGFQKGDLIILAARPSMGKTALALSIARNAAKEGSSIGFISLEMSSEQLVLRMISSEASIKLASLRSGHISSDDWIKLTDHTANLASLKIYIDDNSMQNILEIRTKARKLMTENKIDLLIVDYLQLLHTTKRHESRQTEVSEISRFLKSLAKELRIPIIALSQLSRGVESRVDKRPILSDLRDSGAIEQDADLIIFLYRDSVYNQDTEFPDTAELIIGKQRNGPTGTVQIKYIKEYTSFEDI